MLGSVQSVRVHVLCRSVVWLKDPGIVTSVVAKEEQVRAHQVNILNAMFLNILSYMTLKM